MSASTLLAALLNVTAAMTPKGERRRYALISAAAELLSRSRIRGCAASSGGPSRGAAVGLDHLLLLVARRPGAQGRRVHRAGRDRAAARPGRGAVRAAGAAPRRPPTCWSTCLVGDADGEAEQRRTDLALRALHRLRPPARTARTSSAGCCSSASTPSAEAIERSGACAHRPGDRAGQCRRRCGGLGTRRRRWIGRATAPGPR